MLAREKPFVLDFACGVSRDTFHLESRGLVVIGVDASFKGLRGAHPVGSERGAIASWIMADARHLPCEGVYCFGLLHEFSGEHGEEDVEQFMGEINRLWGDEGVLVLTRLSGEPEEGLPAVQLFSGQMFENVTKGLRAIEVKRYDDVSCTGRTDYHVWSGAGWLCPHASAASDRRSIFEKGQRCVELTATRVN